ncbi:MAG: FlgD immunoglobulin-like domain containing protein [Candidatus Eisenbacteria bacterium]
MRKRGHWLPVVLAAGALAAPAAGPVWGETSASPPRVVTILWSVPDDPDCAGVLLRYSTEGDPAGPEDGAPAPNGLGGRFPGGPGAAGRFVHEGLLPGKTYYYAAFAYDEVPNYAPPARLAVPPPPAEEAPEESPPDAVPTDPLYLRVREGSPNPFNGTVLFTFEIRDRHEVRAEMYDSAGRHVATLANGTFPPGEHDAVWDGRDERGRPAPAGVYFARIDSGRKVITKKAVLVR